MIDVALLRTDPELVRRTVGQRGVDVDVDRLIQVEDDLREAVARFTAVRTQLRRQAMSREPADTAAAQAVQAEMAAATEKVRALQEVRDELCGQLPNLLAPDTPTQGNVELRRVGEPAAADHARQHDTVGTALGILARAAGTGYVWRGDGARLVWAVLTHAQHLLRDRGFTPMLTPAEQAPIGYYGDQIVDAATLPVRLGAFSACPRAAAEAELPAAGHQVEQVVLCRPEDATRWLDECQRNAEDLLRDLELPYRVVRVGLDELDAAAYQAYATEPWFPGCDAYLRTHTTSHCTDYPARRLKIRYLERGRVAQPHTLTATAVTDRTVLAILENHLQPDGSVRIPAALRPHLGGQELIAPPPPAAPSPG
ncbi:MAG TPA: aminoacyl--tRNA ligase-related protein [Pseudonocardiaceae bacterium]|nr:aminoacyl--tRNA ligase-related protein [Pseudonocardiaceae bacterium]